MATTSGTGPLVSIPGSVVGADVAAAGVIQLNIRYWVKTDLSISDGKHRSEVIINVTEALQAAGFAVK